MSKFLLRFTFSFQSVFALALLVASLVNFANAQTTTAQPSPSAATTIAAQKTDSPTGTVQEFYKAMREKRFRDALAMTNLRPAVEKLTAAEMADLTVDFEPMAARVPEKVDLSGEQISGNLASVFVKANDPLTNELKVDEIKLRRENNAWIVLTGDAETETAVKREGAGYFFKLRIEARHADIELSLQDIVKAELAYSVLNRNEFADFETLAKNKIMPLELVDPGLTGYRFRLQLSSDKKKYTVNAEPVQYGKTGKLSYLLVSSDGKSGPRVERDDKNGAPITSKK